MAPTKQLTPSENSVSIRARVRKSKRAIDPEFDTCVETLVSFESSSCNNSNNSKKKKSSGGEGHSLLLTPVPTIVPTVRARSLSRGGSLAPVKRRNRSYSSTSYGRKGSGGSRAGSLANSDNNNDAASDSDCGGGMVDVSLEEEEGVEATTNGPTINTSTPSTTTGSGGGIGGLTADRLSASLHSNSHLNNIVVGSTNHPGGGLPKHPSAHHLVNSGRYASPLAVHRTSSGVSHTSIISSTQSDHLSVSARSIGSRSSARSRSRSRSNRRGGGHPLRMRSLGAASAFAAANNNHQSSGSELEDEDHEVVAEPISIPLKDILSVDEEVPSRNRSGSGSFGGGSDFFSSAASDVGKTDEATASGMNATPKSPTPPPNHNGRVLYRIFLHTLSHGYVEFSLDHANSHDIFMAYLKAHLPPERIPQRDAAAGNKSGGNNKQSHSTALRTMVLTPTKEVPPNLLSASTHTTQTQPAGNNHSNPPPSQSTTTYHNTKEDPPQTLPRPHLTRSSSSTTSRLSINAIDKLHSKAIKQRLQEESTPYQRMKDRFATILSNMIDCACCQDTTTVAPNLEMNGSSKSGNSSGLQYTTKEVKPPRGTASSSSTGAAVPTTLNQSQSASPNTRTLRSKGIRGLSFEESSQMSCEGTPKLSYEKSFDKSCSRSGGI